MYVKLSIYVSGYQHVIIFVTKYKIGYIHENPFYWKRQKPAEISLNKKEKECIG